MSKSLYKVIAESVTEEGVLQKSFKLPERTKEGGITFADGAMDGIYIYHTAHSPLGEPEKEEIGKLIKHANEDENDEFLKASEGFAKFCEEHRAISIIDDVQRFILDHTDTLNAQKILDFAYTMLTESENKECVKVGLSIIELFVINPDKDNELCDIIRTVGLSDEFTIFSVFCMRKWTDGEKELLELAKKVRGWGRIHCIDFIEAENAETKEWLFFNGVDNNIIPAYSAWPVFEKSDFKERMQKDSLSYEELHAVLKLTDALMDEGPVSGISNMEDPKGFLESVLKKAEGDYPFTEDDRRTLTDIAEWGSDEEQSE